MQLFIPENGQEIVRCKSESGIHSLFEKDVSSCELVYLPQTRRIDLGCLGCARITTCNRCLLLHSDRFEGH